MTDMIKRDDALAIIGSMSNSNSYFASKAAQEAYNSILALPTIDPAAPAWLSNCIVCGRVVDTREKLEGGDTHGCEYAEGWVCSSDCAETLHPDPDWMKESLVDPAAIREAALREAYEVVYKWWFGDGNALPQELILALIGETK